MARIRYIKPGIMTNEELCELGPYAYILFTSLWMLADRDGRLEDRPKRIKVEAMPLWDEMPWQAVENLLEKLSETGFIHRYEVAGVRYIQVTKWRKHQVPHPRESASVIPAPDEIAPITSATAATSEEAYPRMCPGSEKAMSSRVGMGMGMGMGSGGGAPVSGVEGASVDNSSPPPKKTPTQPPAAAKRKPPASERSAVQLPRKAPARAERSRQGPQEFPRARAAPTDFWPHKPEDVRLVRESLNELATEIRLPPPDDGIVRTVLDIGRGASGKEIHEVLVELWRRRKFGGMHSWGLVPLVVGEYFAA